MEDSKSNHEKYLEQIASFDPLSNPSDFENIGIGDKDKNFSKSSDFDFFSDKTNDIATNSTTPLSPIASKETKPVSESSEKLKSLSKNSNTYYNADNHYHESPARVPLSSLTLPDRNQLSSSHSNVTENISISLSPKGSKRFKQNNFKDQSPHHSFNSYCFNNSTNISSSSGSIKNDSFKPNLIASKNKKYDGKRYINRAEYNSTGGSATDCTPSLRRRSFQTMKPKYNSVTREFDSGRFHITLSSHSEVSQSENSSCEENEKEKEKKKDKNASNETKKNRKVKRFNISYSKNLNSEGPTNLSNDCEQENVFLKHACSDRSVVSNYGDHHTESNTENSTENNDDDDDIFYKMQQSSMPVLHRHKKKGSKSSKNSNNNSINQPPNTPELNNDLNSTKNQNNNETNFNLNSNHNSPQVQDQNTQINTNVFSPPPKSTPFSPPILNIDLNSTLTSNSLSAKLGCQGETESKGQPDHSDDLISIF